MKHRKIGGMPGDTDKIGDSLLERGVLAILVRKVRKWKEGQMHVGDKPASASKTVKGGAIGTIAFVLLTLLQACKGWLISIGISESAIKAFEAILQLATGGGAAYAGYGMRQSQGRATAAADSARAAAHGASDAARGAEKAAEGAQGSAKAAIVAVKDAQLPPKGHK